MKDQTINLYKLTTIAIALLLIFGFDSPKIDAAGLPHLQRTVDSQTLQLTNINSNISQLNNSVDNLTVSNDTLYSEMYIMAEDLHSQSESLELLSSDFSSLNLAVDALTLEVSELKAEYNLLSEKVDNLNYLPPEDFAFFTNHEFGYGSYFMSPAFDGKDFTNFSMSFTCTSQTNDEIKYWIETSADGINWSPWGYYHVRCNGIYGGASINSGQMPARYFSVAVFQITNNSNTNTITSVGRFSN